METVATQIILMEKVASHIFWNLHGKRKVNLHGKRKVPAHLHHHHQWAKKRRAVQHFYFVVCALGLRKSFVRQTPQIRREKYIYLFLEMPRTNNGPVPLTLA